MHRMPRDRFSAWQDLDALVGAEFDALDRRRPEPASAEAADDRRAEDPSAFDAPDFASEFAPEFADEPFDEEGDDEEAFIERTAAWLRDRSDADALLDAIRAALDEVAEGPSEAPSPDRAATMAPDVAHPGDAPRAEHGGDA